MELGVERVTDLMGPVERGDGAERSLRSRGDSPCSAEEGFFDRSRSPLETSKESPLVAVVADGRWPSSFRAGSNPDLLAFPVLRAPGGLRRGETSCQREAPDGFLRGPESGRSPFGERSTQYQVIPFRGSGKKAGAFLLGWAQEPPPPYLARDWSPGSNPRTRSDLPPILWQVQWLRAGEVFSPSVGQARAFRFKTERCPSGSTADAGSNNASVTRQEGQGVLLEEFWVKERDQEMSREVAGPREP